MIQHNSDLPDLSLFLASSAHDMKNSVSVLSGTLENLLASTASKMTPEFQQMAHMLYETRRLNNNLIQMLALYKSVGSPTYPFDPQNLEIEQFIAEISAYNQILFDSKHIEFEIDYEADLIWNFDEDLVRGVVGHALNNAIRYTKDKIILSIHDVDNYLEIRVIDNGTGYPDNMLNDGVKPMSGVNFATGSTGLGLYFSSEVARMHQHRGRNGNIKLENQMNPEGNIIGGCFLLRLP